MFDSLPSGLRTVLVETPELKRAYLVGGCVRDWLLQLPHTDYDIEVFGLDYPTLAKALARWGRVDLVGRAFGVVKLSLPDGEVHDFSIPRRDSKVAAGHKGFSIAFDASLTPEAAAARRDYTINSLMYDPRTDELHDFFGGREDLNERRLRHTSDAFTDDPLRVLRGMQLAGRFDLEAEPETVVLARSIKHNFPELAKERVREEWFKWAEKSTKPSQGIHFLCATEWIENFPELNAIREIPQEPEWHPEGDVYRHTLYCCDALVDLPRWQEADSESRIVYMLATLTHDFGKAQTTERTEKQGRWRIISPGHEIVSGTLAEAFLQSINAPRVIRERVVPLVVNHMAHFSQVSDRAVRRLAKRLEPENIEGLLTIMTADAFGRPPLPRVLPEAVRNIAAKAEELAVRRKASDPILLGRHLIEYGLPPGRELGALLKAAYEAQLTGEFGDLASARDWLLRNCEITLPEHVRAALAGRKNSR